MDIVSEIQKQVLRRGYEFNERIDLHDRLEIEAAVEAVTGRWPKPHEWAQAGWVVERKPYGPSPPPPEDDY